MIQERKSKKGALAGLILAAVLLALAVLLENLSGMLGADAVPDFLAPTSQLFVVLKKGAVYSLVAVSMNLLNGFTGLFSLGQAGFMLLGAYTYAILTVPMSAKDTVYYLFGGSAVPVSLPDLFGGVDSPVGLILGVVLAILLGGCVAAFFAFLIGLPVLRLKSDYLAIATLGFAEILRAIFQWPALGPVTNGANMITQIPTFNNFNLTGENGAVIFGPGDPGPLLCRTEMERAAALALCRDILAQPRCEVLISGANTSYLCPKEGDMVTLVRDFVGNNVALLPRPEDMPEPFVKVSAYCREGAAGMEPVLAPRWRDRFRAAVAGERWLDFTLADKGTGLEQLCAALGVSPAEVTAFGDNYNDLPMLERAGTAYLLETAVPELRARFSRRCRRVEDVLKTL